MKIIVALLLCLIGLPAIAQKISDLPETASISNSYLFIVARPNVASYKFTYANLVGALETDLNITTGAFVDELSGFATNLTVSGNFTNLNTNATIVLLAKTIQRRTNDISMGVGSVDFQYPNAGAADGVASIKGAQGAYSFIGGGGGNLITNIASGSFIGGGIDNIIHSQSSFIGAGNDLQIINPNAVASRVYDFIGGGTGNVIDQGLYSAIVGGSQNHIGDGSQTFIIDGAFIGGGFQNEVDANYGSILGGLVNVVTAYGGQIVGSQIINSVSNSVMLGYGQSNVLTVAPSGTTNAGKFVVRPSFSGTSYVRVDDTNGTARVQLGVYPGFSAFGTLWLGGVTPNTTNYSVSSDGFTTSLNGFGSIALSTGVGGSKWIVTVDGHFLPATGNFYDLGSAAIPVRSLYLGTMPGSGDHVAVNSSGLLMRTNIAGGGATTQMVAAAIGTLTLSNALNVATLNVATINLTNFLGSNQVYLGMAQLTNVSFVSLSEGHILIWNDTMKKFTNSVPPAGGGSGSTQMVSAAIGVLLQTNDISFVVSNQANVGSFLLPAKTNFANTFYATSGGTNHLGETVFDNHAVITSNLTVGVMVGSGDHVAVNSLGLLMRTNIVGGSGGVGPTNANQFGASTTLTIKSGVTLTNISSWGTLGANGPIVVESANSIGWGDGSVTIEGNSSSDYLAINTGSTERLRVVSSGNVGIGTNDPQTMFHVVGPLGNSYYFARPPASTFGGVGGMSSASLTSTENSDLGGASGYWYKQSTVDWFAGLEGTSGEFVIAREAAAPFLRISTAGTITQTGHHMFSADNTYDIGAAGATRPRTIFVAGAIVQGFSVTAPIAPSVQGAAYWNDGTNVCVVLRNSAGTLTTNKLSMTAWP